MAIKNEVNTFTLDNRFEGPDSTFVQTATFQFIAQFNSTSARFRATNAGNNTGALFISDIATLRWDIIRENTNVGGNLVFNRYDANGTLQNTPLVIQSTDGQIRVPDGSSSAPQYGFQGEASLGIFRISTGIMGFAAGSTQMEYGGGVLRLIGPDFSLIRLRDNAAAVDEKQWRIISQKGNFEILTENDAQGGVQAAMIATRIGASVATIFINGQTLKLTSALINMVNLPTGPGGGLVSGDLYVKQSQTFAPTELVLGMQP